VTACSGAAIWTAFCPIDLLPLSWGPFDRVCSPNGSRFSRGRSSTPGCCQAYDGRVGRRQGREGCRASATPSEDTSVWCVRSTAQRIGRNRRRLRHEAREEHGE
jgi:hypothetical protein